jgi:hypothetical protein
MEAQSYSNCPYGRACIFDGWHGTGNWGIMDGCNTWIDLQFLSKHCLVGWDARKRNVAMGLCWK